MPPPPQRTIVPIDPGFHIMKVCQLLDGAMEIARERNPESEHLATLALQKLGLVQLPVYNSRTGHLLSMVTVVRAMQLLGQDTCPVWVVDLPYMQEVLASILLNNHFNTWLWKSLAVRLKELKAAGQNLQLTGLMDSDIGPLMAADWEPPKLGTFEDVKADTEQQTFL